MTKKKMEQIDLITQQLDRISEFEKDREPTAKFKAWLGLTESFLLEVFKDKPDRVNDFTKIKYISSHTIMGMPKRNSELRSEGFHKGLREVKAVLESMIEELTTIPPADIYETNKDEYVNIERIKELKTVNSKSYDCAKLIALCEELNVAWEKEMFFSVAMLFRAIVDHIPPVFKQKSFTEVANNYSGGASFRKVMKQMDESYKSIADLILHVQITDKHALPNKTQVNFSHELDILLGKFIEII